MVSANRGSSSFVTGARRYEREIKSQRLCWDSGSFLKFFSLQPARKKDGSTGNFLLKSCEMKCCCHKKNRGMKGIRTLDLDAYCYHKWRILGK